MKEFGGVADQSVSDLEAIVEEKDERIKELEARIAMLNKCIDNNESNFDYAIATDSVRAFLTAPIEDLKDLKF